jgi:hypothetical protein
MAGVPGKSTGVVQVSRAEGEALEDAAPSNLRHQAGPPAGGRRDGVGYVVLLHKAGTVQNVCMPGRSPPCRVVVREWITGPRLGCRPAPMGRIIDRWMIGWRGPWSLLTVGSSHSM